MKIIKPRKGSNGKQVYRFPICDGKDKGGNCLKARSYTPMPGGVYIRECDCGSRGMLLSLKAMKHMGKEAARLGKGV